MLSNDERREILDSLPLPRRELAELFLDLLRAYEVAVVTASVVEVTLIANPTSQPGLAAA